MPYFYILQSLKNSRFYYGSTTDLERRLAEHNRGKTKATRYLRPWKLIYYEQFPNLTQARKREREVKSWKNKQKVLALIDNYSTSVG